MVDVLPQNIVSQEFAPVPPFYTTNNFFRVKVRVRIRIRVAGAKSVAHDVLGHDFLGHILFSSSNFCTVNVNRIAIYYYTHGELLSFMDKRYSN